MRWLLLVLVGCAKKVPPEVPTPTPAPAAPAGPRLSGTASWYGDAFAGRPTASGVPFDPDALTAAHRTLPFGTIVRVERVDSGAAVTVVINDRGAFGGNRVIDLSEAAAAALDMIDDGLAPVKITVVGCDEDYPACE